MKKENKILCLKYKINEIEADVEVQEMILEDYNDDLIFASGLTTEINKSKIRINKLKEMLLSLEND